MKIEIDLEQAILKVLHYFDLFRFPLTFVEIHTYLSVKCTINEVQHSLKTLVKKKEIFFIESCYLLSNSQELVTRKKNGFEKAQQELKKAKRIARIINWFPYVRMVSVSGSLSKGFADAYSDIDFFIITNNQNLWTCRSLLHIFKKITFLFNMQDHFCMNYFIANGHLAIEEQNYFTAIELSTLIPLTGNNYYNQLLEENAWRTSYLPNASLHQLDPSPPPSRRLKWFLEKIFQSAKLNHFFMNFTDKKWQKKWQKKGINKETYQLAFKTNLYVSKNHPTNNQKIILDQYLESTKQRNGRV